MTNLTDIQKELDRLNDEYITLLKDRIKELELANKALLLILKK
tara:strand:+ start:360 stop:488 length:129 start_codon:yes stop_codon:yes gene_type:complete